MLNIPKGVSQHLVDELNKFQDQIHILINNHKILTHRARKAPENQTIAEQILAVEAYLLQFGREQQPVIENIRAECRALKQRAESAPAPEARASASEERKENRELLPAPPTMADRMAQVREKKAAKKRKKMPPQLRPQSKDHEHMAPSSSPPSPPLPSSGDAAIGSPDSDHVAMDGEEEENFDDGEPKLKPGQYPGYVEHAEKMSFPKDTDRKVLDDLVMPVKRQQMTLSDSNREDLEDMGHFLRNIDLITSEDILKLDLYYAEMKAAVNYNRKKRFFAPPPIEKKQKPSYNWLSAEMSSPPLLRKRRRNPPAALADDLVEQPKPRRRRGQSTGGAGAMAGAADAASTKRAATPSPPSTPSSRALTPDKGPSSGGSSTSSIGHGGRKRATPPTESDAKVAKVSKAASAEKQPISKQKASAKRQDEAVVVTSSASATTATPPATKSARIEAKARSAKSSTPNSSETASSSKPAVKVSERRRAQMAKTRRLMQEELDKLLEQSVELKKTLEENSKFTVSTRKERSRKNDMIAEDAALDEKISKLRKAIEQFVQD